MFFAYLIVDAKSGEHRLFIDSARLNADLRSYLLGIKIQNYEDITGQIESLSRQNYKIWVSPFSSYAIYNAVTNKVIVDDLIISEDSM